MNDAVRLLALFAVALQLYMCTNEHLCSLTRTRNTGKHVHDRTEAQFVHGLEFEHIQGCECAGSNRSGDNPRNTPVSSTLSQKKQKGVKHLIHSPCSFTLRRGARQRNIEARLEAHQPLHAH